MHEILTPSTPPAGHRIRLAGHMAASLLPLLLPVLAVVVAIVVFAVGL
jgi:hypothetical protein